MNHLAASQMFIVKRGEEGETAMSIVAYHSAVARHHISCGSGSTNVNQSVARSARRKNGAKKALGARARREDKTGEA